MNGTLRILVADDDVLCRKLLTSQLTKAGYQVLIASDGQEALNWIFSPHHRPDLVLLDLLMPRFSGLEVLERLKTVSWKLPVILMSGAERPIAREGVSQSSPDAFIKKPFLMNDLLLKIDNLL
ncbi:response regulator [Larkinella bovis]|uniref:Response regulator n=1 Tax=Larkinella bovis TaxID=683041 RepID=A0ABW0I5L8_9BACT